MSVILSIVLAFISFIVILLLVEEIIRWIKIARMEYSMHLKWKILSRIRHVREDIEWKKKESKWKKESEQLKKYDKYKTENDKL